MRFGIRARLTARYVAVFLTCGAAMVCLNYVILTLAAWEPTPQLGVAVPPSHSARGPSWSTPQRRWSTTLSRRNRPGGAIEVATGLEGSRAFLIARSDGQLVPDEEVPRLAKPFHRLHGDGAGFGPRHRQRGRGPPRRRTQGRGPLRRRPGRDPVVAAFDWALSDIVRE